MDSSTKNALFIVGVVLSTIVVAFVSLLIGAMIISPAEPEEQPVAINFYIEEDAEDIFTLEGKIGERITLPTAEECEFEKEGYTLKNWVIEEDEEVITYNPGDQITLEAGLDFYAVWEENKPDEPTPDDPSGTFKVTFYKNNALDEILVEYNKTEGSKLELPFVEETQDGMRFKKWMRIYSEEEQVAFLPETEITITEDIDFYAVWVDPTNPGYDEEIYSDGDGVLYKLSEDKTHAILLDATKLGRDSYEILNNFANLPVEVIETNSFKNMNIKELIISKNIKEIKQEAFFGCDDLTTVYFDANIGKFSGDKDEGCPLFEYYNPDNEHETFVSPITNLIIGKDVEYIPPEAFMYLKIKSVTIPTSVKRIFDGAFACCEELETVIFEEGSILNEIGEVVFEDCTKLQSITIPSSVTSIGSYAFCGCTNLVSVTLPDLATSIGTSAFDGCTNLISINLPNSLTTIESCLFRYCTSLQSITIPSLVTKIDNEAFNGCSSLASILIPSSVTSIGSSAFSGCTGLTSITIPNSVTSIGYSAFRGCESLTSINLSNSLTIIESDCFYGCTSLRSINLPNSINEIAYSAFSACTSLESVRFPDTLTIIGDYAFEGCLSLTNIIIPETVKYIKQGAFSRSGLKQVRIYDSIEEIGDGAFASCTQLENFNIAHSSHPAESINIGDSILYESTGIVKFLGLTTNMSYRFFADYEHPTWTYSYHDIKVKSEYLDEYCEMWRLSKERYSYVTRTSFEWNDEIEDLVEVTYYWNPNIDSESKTPTLVEHTEENATNFEYYANYGGDFNVWYGFYNISTYND